MTTINRIKRTLEKAAKRKADRSNRKALVAEHNLVYQHRQAEAVLRPKVTDCSGKLAWTPPMMTVLETTPTLKQMFFLQEPDSTEPQQG